MPNPAAYVLQVKPGDIGPANSMSIGYIWFCCGASRVRCPGARVFDHTPSSLRFLLFLLFSHIRRASEHLTLAMALPSSPPLLAEVEADIPSSPPLLPTSSLLPIALPSRKRHWTEHEDSLSSDPLFSEDPSGAEDLASYDRPKRKRMVRGPWYSVGKKGSQSGLRQSMPKDACRNLDSGVWMGSDQSDESLDGILSSQDKMRRLAGQDGMDVPEEEPVVLGGAEQMANGIVQACVEAGKESVDLSELGLRDISPTILRPLHQLIRPSHIALTEPPSEGEFNVLTPAIKLFLARNALTSLPPELFHLENITVLSLRNNDLTELPPCIGRLHKIRELNIGGNDIRYLPWELFHLFDCPFNLSSGPVKR